MAKVRNNLVVHGLSGMLGHQLVIRRQRNGEYTVAAAPGPSSREISEAQKAHHERFRQAIAFAKSAKEVPEYKAAAEARGQSSFNVAVADFLHPPEIQHIDLSAYQGAPGDSISITAIDDIIVRTVGIMIVNDDGTLVEKGTAIPTTGANSWLYKATSAAASPSVKIVVDVADLAGQVSEATLHS
jgi:dsDNA-specific endonuclease/ATPase MutS2